jgi:CrcB protein
MTFSTILAIFLGGGLGSVCRFGVGKVVLSVTDSRFPWATLSANLLSCLVLGLIMSTAGKGVIRSEGWLAFLTIGFCGGFSTFSTFSFETLRLMRDGMYLFAGLNVAVSVVACLLILYFLVK